MSDLSRPLNMSYYDDGVEDVTELEYEPHSNEMDLEDRDEFQSWTRDESYGDAMTPEERQDDPDYELNDVDLIKSSYFTELRKLESHGLVDIGNLLSWHVSTLKQGCDSSQLREDDPDTYWQSDGPQPHTITIHFLKRVAIKTLLIFTNYPLDESYTPSEILIRAGTGEHDLQDVVTCNLKEPSGWSVLGFDQILKTFLIKVIIKGNHQNGKDTHIRSLKVFQQLLAKNENHLDISDVGFDFKSKKMLSESCIR